VPEPDDIRIEVSRKHSIEYQHLWALYSDME